MNPNATSPVISRLTMVDLPMPGWPWTHMPVLDTKPWRSHSEGSRPTGSAVCMCRPIGTPGGAAPEETANGNSPHTCVVVPCQTVPPSTLAARPPSTVGQPHARGTGRPRYTAPGSAESFDGAQPGGGAAARGPAPVRAAASGVGAPAAPAAIRPRTVPAARRRGSG